MNLASTISIHAEQQSQPLARYKRRWLVCIDFDDTLAEAEHGVKNGKFGKLNSEAIKLVKWLNKEGYGVVVLTARTEKNQEGIKQYLAEHGAKVLKVTSDKPPAAAYVDDRAIEWRGNATKVIDELKKLEGR